jgi:hypothetical protein
VKRNEHGHFRIVYRNGEGVNHGERHLPRSCYGSNTLHVARTDTDLPPQRPWDHIIPNCQTSHFWVVDQKPGFQNPRLPTRSVHRAATRTRSIRPCLTRLFSLQERTTPKTFMNAHSARQNMPPLKTPDTKTPSTVEMTNQHTNFNRRHTKLSAEDQSTTYP